MAAIVEQGLRAGALGFSTSRTLLHKSIDGIPVPGTFADRNELFGIGEALRNTGTGVFQIAAQHEDVPTELDWIDELAAWTGRPVSFNLSQIDPDPELWRKGSSASSAPTLASWLRSQAEASESFCAGKGQGIPF
jgi:N-acyl-D-aspartate/D-glutamate deacylase